MSYAEIQQQNHMLSTTSWGLKFSVIECNHMINECHIWTVGYNLSGSAMPGSLPSSQGEETCRLQSPSAGKRWDNENPSCAQTDSCPGHNTTWLPQRAALSAHLHQKSQKTTVFDGTSHAASAAGSSSCTYAITLESFHY